jgi:hypothetical protein
MSRVTYLTLGNFFYYIAGGTTCLYSFYRIFSVRLREVICKRKSLNLVVFALVATKANTHERRVKKASIQEKLKFWCYSIVFSIKLFYTIFAV